MESILMSIENENEQRTIASDHYAVTHGVFRKGETFPMHRHDYYEMEVICSGNVTHTLNNVVYNGGKGEIYLLSPWICMR